MPVALQSTGFDVLYRAALDGAGVAVLSRILIESRLAAGELVHLLPDWIYGTSTVYVAVPTRILMPARTRAFLAFLAERMAARATEPRAQSRLRR
jgi:DNA-binding transcriptional LysR family regulator